ncbi:hypothetical protein NTE_02901 [Candidatus Nitrososphaera evergladensis SR1]|uniref:Uncharacterized protein n=1 Tax=Candidatus Nitrososphaera evergladensis SR1 TaxID=1459636 RepID=A0A075N0C0_9ARCH|nr:hypothetical protein [Candidatus Nitrososphaera evergladensis]AIF84939.1 hypothetical protein NTE_02901 [Candidatus Nitrososphaera evergladensis SR1]
MFEEAITVAAIIGGSAAAVWYAKSKFQPGIERDLERIESATYERPESLHRAHNNNNNNQQ